MAREQKSPAKKTVLKEVKHDRRFGAPLEGLVATTKRKLEKTTKRVKDSYLP